MATKCNKDEDILESLVEIFLGYWSLSSNTTANKLKEAGLYWSKVKKQGEITLPYSPSSLSLCKISANKSSIAIFIAS